MGQTTTFRDDLTPEVSPPAGAEEGAERIEDWFVRGLCANLDPDEFFVESHGAQKRARTMCFACPVRLECLSDALNNGVNWGIWGGMTERERRAILRRAPEVTDWYPVLRKIQDEQDEHRRTARGKLVELWRKKQERENSSSES